MRSLFIITIIFTFLGTSGTGLGKQPPAPAPEPGAVRLALTHLPPYRMVAGDQASGILIEALNRITFSMNLRIKPLAAPFKRCLVLLKEGKADLYIGLFRRPEREAYLYFVEPPFQEKTVKVFYLRKGEGDRIQRYEDLYDLKKAVGIRAGFKNFPRFDADTRILKEGVATDEQNLVKLSLGRIDAFLHTQEVGDYLIETQGYAQAFEKAPFQPNLHNPAYIAISRKSPLMKMAKEFEKALQVFIQNGGYQEIKTRYFNRLRQAAPPGQTDPPNAYLPEPSSG